MEGAHDRGRHSGADAARVGARQPLRDVRSRHGAAARSRSGGSGLTLYETRISCRVRQADYEAARGLDDAGDDVQRAKSRVRRSAPAKPPTDTNELRTTCRPPKSPDCWTPPRPAVMACATICFCS